MPDYDAFTDLDTIIVTDEALMAAFIDGLLEEAE
jgi:hypothetical protein